MKKKVRKDGKKKAGKVRKVKRTPKPLSNLQRAIKRALPSTPGSGRVTGLAAPRVPYAGATHEQLKQIMTGLAKAGSPLARGWSAEPPPERADRRISAIDYEERTVTYSDDQPMRSARGAYTRPARW